MSDFIAHAALLEPAIALEECVSRTNLSEVWRGKRRSDGEAVAVKFAITPEAAAALTPEADAVRALQNSGVPGIVPAEFVATPVPHLVFPWKGSRTFRTVLDAIRTGDDRARAASLLFHVVRTVAAVQREGFLHGDLKPENILVDDHGYPWLTDFGMARAIHRARLDSRVSRSLDGDDCGWGGTLHYMPPEGLQGEAPAPTWDVYALGVMLHEVLLGARPDRAATPDSLRAVLPGDVVDLLLKALAYTPSERIPTAGLLLYLLDPLLPELTRTGFARLLSRLGRLALAGLAAFFVALRYTSVLALVALYAGLLIASWQEPAAILILGPFAIVHFVVRWEGPETDDEARLRRQGGVV